MNSGQQWYVIEILESPNGTLVPWPHPVLAMDRWHEGKAPSLNLLSVVWAADNGRLYTVELTALKINRDAEPKSNTYLELGNRFVEGAYRIWGIVSGEKLENVMKTLKLALQPKDEKNE